MVKSDLVPRVFPNRHSKITTGVGRVASGSLSPKNPRLDPMNINFDDDELTGAFDCCEHGSGPVGVTVVGLAYTCEQGPAPKEGASSLLMGGQLWQSGKVLAAALAEGKLPSATRETLAGKRAIELGCGMAGLPGVALALLGAEVTLTDTASVLPLLTANAHAASEAAASAGRPVRLKAEELDWLDDAGLARRMGEEKFDLVVCADVAYSCDLHEALLRSVQAVIAPEGVAIFVEFDRSGTVEP
jgi:predicted nicotinamide N-methyase